MPYDVDDYTLLSGVLSIAKITAGTVGTYTDVGNCPKFEFTADKEAVEHQESRTPHKYRDQRVVLVKGYTISFDLDGRNLENLQMFLMGTLDGTTKILGFQNLDQEYALKLTEDNRKGKNFIWVFHRCQIEPEGALALIGENQFAKMSFSAVSLADLAGNPESPFFHTEEQTTP
ncbi:MAG: hypothetical protein V1816_10905 [Pseudomonadota bacterium]